MPAQNRESLARPGVVSTSRVREGCGMTFPGWVPAGVRGANSTSLPRWEKSLAEAENDLAEIEQAINQGHESEGIDELRRQRLEARDLYDFLAETVDCYRRPGSDERMKVACSLLNRTNHWPGTKKRPLLCGRDENCTNADTVRLSDLCLSIPAGFKTGERL